MMMNNYYLIGGLIRAAGCEIACGEWEAGLVVWRLLAMAVVGVVDEEESWDGGVVVYNPFVCRSEQELSFLHLLVLFSCSSKSSFPISRVGCA